MDLKFPYEQPIKQYFIKESGRAGIIFTAVTPNVEMAEKFFAETKHDKIAWVSYEDAAKLDAADCVDGFHDTIEKASQIWHAHIKPIGQALFTRG